MSNGMLKRAGSALLVLFLAGLWLAWAGASPAAAGEQDLFQAAEKAKADLAGDPKAQGLRHEWTKVIDRYKNILSRYPDGETADRCLLSLGDLYLGLYKRSRRSSDADLAIDYYRLLTRKFPKSPTAATAQLWIGHVFYRHKKDPDLAYKEYYKVELNHPRSVEVEEARQMLARLEKTSVPENPQHPAPGSHRRRGPAGGPAGQRRPGHRPAALAQPHVQPGGHRRRPGRFLQGSSPAAGPGTKSAHAPVPRPDRRPGRVQHPGRNPHRRRPAAAGPGGPVRPGHRPGGARHPGHHQLPDFFP